jgi:hypothetical protein
MNASSVRIDDPVEESLLRDTMIHHLFIQIWR